MRDATARRLSAIHAALLRLSRGRLGTRLVDNDMLVLTTTGRRSGRPHAVPLLFLRGPGDDLVVIASWGGRPYHPDWYLNLLARPDAEVLLPGGETRRVRARTASAQERARWWPRVVEAYEGYDTYRSRTDREIPIVILERSDEGDDR